MIIARRLTAPSIRDGSRLLANSTRAWRQKRSADHWANRAIAEGHRSRAAYKLTEINERFGKFLRPAVNCVDLGASPGGWSVVAAKLVKLREPNVKLNDVCDTSNVLKKRTRGQVSGDGAITAYLVWSNRGEAGVCGLEADGRDTRGAVCAR